MHGFSFFALIISDEVLKAVSGTGSVNGRSPGGPGIDHYKALLKEQEDQVLALRKNLEEMQAVSSSSEKTVLELKVQVQQLKDQNSLLKAQKGKLDWSPNFDKYYHKFMKVALLGMQVPLDFTNNGNVFTEVSFTLVFWPTVFILNLQNDWKDGCVNYLGH